MRPLRGKRHLKHQICGIPFSPILPAASSSPNMQYVSPLPPALRLTPRPSSVFEWPLPFGPAPLRWLVGGRVRATRMVSFDVRLGVGEGNCAMHHGNFCFSSGDELGNSTVTVVDKNLMFFLMFACILLSWLSFVL